MNQFKFEKASKEEMKQYNNFFQIDLKLISEFFCVPERQQTISADSSILMSICFCEKQKKFLEGESHDWAGLKRGCLMAFLQLVHITLILYFPVEKTNPTLTIDAEMRPN